MNLINPKTNKSVAEWYKNFTLHEQDSDSKFYDESAYDRVTPMVYAEGSFDMHDALIIGRTRVMSIKEYIQ